ncbi:MAG: hypothetical protein HRU15_16510, partial [Planctomycetes bacterium]|nr:hypothetical protein [Planctomycetota bacterium]
MTLTQEELWQFDCQGFVQLKGFLNSEDAEELKESVTAYRNEQYTQVQGIALKESRVRELMFHKKIASISEHFFGEYRLSGSVLVINPGPYGGDGDRGGLAWPIWHQDADHNSYAYHKIAWPCPLMQLRFFFALNDLD